METTKLERTGNLNSAPDGRVDAHQRDFEFADWQRGLGRHGVKIRSKPAMQLSRLSSTY